MAEPVPLPVGDFSRVTTPDGTVVCIEVRPMGQPWAAGADPPFYRGLGVLLAASLSLLGRLVYGNQWIVTAWPADERTSSVRRTTLFRGGRYPAKQAYKAAKDKIAATGLPFS